MKVSNNYAIARSNVRNIYQNKNFVKQNYDSVSFTGGEKSKKSAVKPLLVINAALIGTAALYSIGRNPAKVAKTLRGNSEIVQPSYKKGMELLNKIMAQTSDEYKISFDDVLKIFDNPKHSTELGETLEKFETFISGQETPPSKEVIKALETLKANLAKYTEEINSRLLKGEQVDCYDQRRLFADKNLNFADTIERYLSETAYNFDYFSDERKAADALRNNFLPYRFETASNIMRAITDCPADIVNTSQTLYHGTRNADKLLENGFSPYVSNQLKKSPRELGAAVYTTPDIQVASSFGGLMSKIIPIKLDSDAKIAFVDEKSYGRLSDTIFGFLNERMSKSAQEELPKDELNSLIEVLISSAFKKAGYDAAYVPKGVSAGFNLFGGNINEVCGRNQSQVAIFSPEKIEIVPRQLKERISDLGKKLKAEKQGFDYAKDHPFAGLF